jgi:PAS domain S-box-containing protein
MAESETCSPVISLARAIELVLHEQDLFASVNEALGLIGESADQDRAYLFEVFRDPVRDRLLMSQRCEWVSEGTKPEIDNPELVDADFLEHLSRWHDAFSRNEIIEGPVRTFPECERTLLGPQGILSLLCVPVFADEVLCGFIGFDNCHEEYSWTEDDKALLRTIAVAIGAALGRQSQLKKLKEGEERFRKLISGNSTVAVQGFFEDGRITYWNHASESMYGYTEEEVLGEDIFDLLVPSEDQQKIHELFLRLKDQDQEDRQAIQATYRHKQGHDVPVLSCLISLDKLDQPTEHFSFDLDLTEQKRLESQLLRNQRLEAIGSLATGIAHDLNNVLAPMQMCLDSLTLDHGDDESMKPFLDILAKSTQRATDMSQKLLSFARGSEVKAVDVELKELLEDLLKLLRSTLPRQIEIKADIPSDLPGMQADPTQIHQILMNLALNARDAMPDGGVLHLVTKIEKLEAPPVDAMGEDFIPGDHVVIEVSDTGEGMPPETLLKAFEPFFTTKKNHRGTGLGLSTSLSLLKSHSAWIYPYSFPGSGTTFRLYFPLRTGSAASSPPAEKTDELPQGQGEYILVVDDESSIREMTCGILKQYGYHPLEAGNGQQAVEVFKAQPEIQLVITDLMMPVMDGTAAMREFRSLRPKVPLLATSGMSSTNADTDTARALADRYLSKPCGVVPLLQTVRQLLDQEA